MSSFNIFKNLKVLGWSIEMIETVMPTLKSIVSSWIQTHGPSMLVLFYWIMSGPHLMIVFAYSSNKRP